MLIGRYQVERCTVKCIHISSLRHLPKLHFNILKHCALPCILLSQGYPDITLTFPSIRQFKTKLKLLVLVNHSNPVTRVSYRIQSASLSSAGGITRIPRIKALRYFSSTIWLRYIFLRVQKNLAWQSYSF